MKFGKWANYGPEKELIKLFLDAFRVCYSAPSALPSALSFLPRDAMLARY